jgi:hypothetical protein
MAEFDAILSPQRLEQLWAEHIKGEFETKDVEATLSTMVDDTREQSRRAGAARG